LAENLSKASTTRTVAAITERNASERTTNVAENEPQTRSAPTVQAQADPATPDTWTPPAMRTSKVAAAVAAAPAAMPSAQAKIEGPPLSSGVIQTPPIAVIPGSSEPMRPVRVKTVQIKAGATRLASAGPSQPAPPATSPLPQTRPPVPETSSAVVAKAAEVAKPEPARPEPIKHDTADANLPPQPAGHGTGNGLLGVLPASSAPAAPSGPTQAVAVAAVTPQPAPLAAQAPAQPQVIQQNGAIKPVVTHTGWIVQVGALESEDEAQHRIEAARNSAKGLLGKADPFTEPVIAKDNRKLYRARFAGLERGEAEAVCRMLRRSDISCITVRN